jgi:hypothetical protein
MPRTAATPRGRILAVAGAAAALAGAGTAAAGTASAATVPVPGFTAASLHHVLTTMPAPSALAPASGTHGAAVTVTARTGHADAKTGKPAAKTAAKETPARHQTPRVPARPYQMYDSVTPSAIPGGKAVATYADGPYAASPAALHGHNVTWIDTNGTDPAGATVLDVEPGDATPAGAAAWAAHRLDTHPHATAVIYTMRSEWAAAQASIAGLPHWQQHHVRWWIADPTGIPHVVPGSNATQWYWGTHYDISTVNPGF